MSRSLASPWRMRTRVPLTNSSSEPIRIGSGSTIEAAPTSQQAWMVVTRPRVVGDRMATWSPGSMPRACSVAPTIAGLLVELRPRDALVVRGGSRR